MVFCVTILDFLYPFPVYCLDGMHLVYGTAANPLKHHGPLTRRNVNVKSKRPAWTGPGGSFLLPGELYGVE